MAKPLADWPTPKIGGPQGSVPHNRILSPFARIALQIRQGTRRGKGQASVLTILTQIDYYSFSRSEFDTQVQLPVCKRLAIHRKVIFVSARN